MLPVRKPHYALLGRRESYSIGNRQAKKDTIFEAALTAIHHYLNNPNFVSIPNLIAAIYHGDDPQLNSTREALKSNSLFPSTTCLSASGQKILAYLAVLHDKNCLAENGDINLAYTKQIIRSFFAERTQGAIQFDDSAIYNLKAKDTHFQFGKKRFAHLNLPFSSKDNIDTVQNKIQAHIHKQECTERLFQACHKKDLAAAQEALRNGADANSRGDHNSTFLMWAAYNGWLDVALDLFSKSSDDTINAVTEWGHSALLLACEKFTDILFLTKLLERSSPEAINAINTSRDTAILVACVRLRDIHFLTKLLERSSPETINAINISGNTALLLACSKLTDIHFLTKLLERSSPEVINAINTSGETALLIACSRLTDIPFLTKLLERSSPEAINAINPSGNTTLLIACAKLTDITFLTQLLERSSDTVLNAVNTQGDTALLWACAKLTDIAFLTQLLERSSDTVLNAINRQGDTVLISLAWGGNKPQPAQHLFPLILPRLTWTNFRSVYKQSNMPTGKTAWQLVYNHRLEAWADVTRRIGEAMLVECAQRHIPWGRTHHNAAIQKKQLTQGEQTPANVCENTLLEQKKIPEDILGIIRNYNETAFSTPKEALDAINDFLKQHLQQKEQYRKNGSQLFNSVNDVMHALHDYASELNLSLAEYASTLDVPQKG